MTHQKVAAGRGCIYCIWENDGGGKITKKNARYVGQAKDFGVRMAAHQEAVEANKRGSKTAGLNVDRKIASHLASGKKYIMECIKHNLAASELDAWEKHLIAEWQTYGGTYDSTLAWNETQGG